MAEVHLRPVTLANFRECLALQVEDAQTGLIASNAKSLAEAYVNPNMRPLAVYDAAARGFEEDPPAPMVGFTMIEMAAGVGFITRLMIDRAHQGRGYGRATMVEVIRRLRLTPEAEIIATSHLRENIAAARLYAGLGFVPWEIAYATADADEVYLRLP